MNDKQQGKVFWRYDTALVTEAELLASTNANSGSALFEPAYWQARQAVTGQESGRGTTWFLKHNQHEWVLRHYLRGGLISKFNREHYWFRSWTATRSIAEFAVLQHLRQQGFAVPRPVAAQAVRQGLFYRADIIIERIPRARDLLSVLRTAQTNEFYAQLGQFIAAFMRAGLHHADLNIQNILHDEAGQFWLIDFDRARIRPPAASWQDKVIARLQRSFQKEKVRHGIAWQTADWNTFEKHYRAAMS